MTEIPILSFEEPDVELMMIICQSGMFYSIISIYVSLNFE